MPTASLTPSAFSNLGGKWEKSLLQTRLITTEPCTFFYLLSKHLNSMSMDVKITILVGQFGLTASETVHITRGKYSTYNILKIRKCDKKIIHSDNDVLYQYFGQHINDFGSFKFCTEKGPR
jgi:hypothetical protein